MFMTMSWFTLKKSVNSRLNLMISTRSCAHAMCHCFVYAVFFFYSAFTQRILIASFGYAVGKYMNFNIMLLLPICKCLRLLVLLLGITSQTTKQKKVKNCLWIHVIFNIWLVLMLSARFLLLMVHSSKVNLDDLTYCLCSLSSSTLFLFLKNDSNINMYVWKQERIYGHFMLYMLRRVRKRNKGKIDNWKILSV